MIPVIMPVFNIDEQFVNLTDLAIQSIKPEPLVIVDNASTVGAGSLREWADIYIRNKTNLGYAKAVNQGLRLCSSDEFVCVANNDIRVSGGWEQVAFDIFREDPLVASVHFKMIPYDEPFNFGDKIWKTGKERWCTGSFFVMRNSWSFDGEYLNSYDDWDLHLRMYRANYKTAYTNKAQYQHMNSFTQFIIPQREEIDKKNREYFIKKHGDTPENIWQKMFPDQMSQDYQGGFE